MLVLQPDGNSKGIRITVTTFREHVPECRIERGIIMRKRPLALLTAAALAWVRWQDAVLRHPRPPEQRKRQRLPVRNPPRQQRGKTEAAGRAGGAAGVDVRSHRGKSMWTNLSQSEMNFYVEGIQQAGSRRKGDSHCHAGQRVPHKTQNAFRTGTNAPDVATFEISDFGMYKNTDLLENLSTEATTQRLFPRI